MYNIAICDDDKVFILYIKNIIKQIKSKEKHQINFYEYYSGEELIFSMNEIVQYDLLILDMQLGGIDGDETARLFRKKFPNSVLVFCSGVQLPTIKSFKATPFRYLLKSYSDKQFLDEVEEILMEVEKNSRESYIIGHYRSNMIRVKIKSILYIENAKRGSRIIVSPNSEENNFEDPILVDEKLLELSEKFKDLVFAHSSYIVNINHVEYINSNQLFLDNKECLSISRAYQKTFRQIFTKSVANKY